MRKVYDFSKGKRGAVIATGKILTARMSVSGHALFASVEATTGDRE